MSKKNNKNKSTRNNYKIEALEPRLMMDANVDYDDFVGKLDSYDFSDSVNSVVSNAQQNVDQSFNDAISKLNLGVSKAEEFFTELQNDASTAWGNLKNLIASIPSASRDSITLTEIADTINNGNVGFSAKVDGDKLTLSIENNPVKELSEIALDNFSVGLQNLNAAISSKANLTIEFADPDDSDEDLKYTATIGAVGVESSIKVEDLANTIGYMNMSLNDGADDDNDIELNMSYNANDGFKSNLTMNIELALNTGSLPFKFKDNAQIKIIKTANGKVEYAFPEIEFVSDAYSLETLLNALDAFEIPFLKKMRFNSIFGEKSVSEIGGLANKYWAAASLAMNASVNDASGQYVLQMDVLKKCFDAIIKLDDAKKILGKIEIVDSTSKTFDIISGSFLDTDCVSLSAGELTLRFTPAQMNVLNDVDFGLFGLDGIKVDSSIDVKIGINVDKDGRLEFKSIDFEEFVLNLKTDKTDKTIDIGLFSAEVEGCALDYDVHVKKNGAGNFEIDTSDLKVEFDSIELTSGPAHVSIVKASNDYFEYSFDDAEWRMPENIKRFVSLSGDTLEQQLAMYLNTLQSSIRSLVRDKVNLGITNGPVDAVVDVVDKIDKIIYGTDDGSITGLMKLKNGSYVPAFNSVEQFVDIFNANWITVFKIKDADFAEQNITDKRVCSLKYIGSTGSEIVNAAASNVENATTAAFEKYRLDFNIFFKIDKSIDLELSNALGTAFANVSTSGSVDFTGNAGFKFSLLVDFSSKKLSEKTLVESLLDLKSGETLSNDDSVVLDVDFSKYNVEKPFKFSVVEKVSDNPVVENKYEVTVGTGAVSKGSFSATLNNVASTGVSFEVSSNQQVLVLCGKSFEIYSSGSGDAFAELKLLNSRLQTTILSKKIDVSKGQLVLNLTPVNFEKTDTPASSFTLNFDQFTAAINDGIVLGDDIVAQLNEFLSLQDENGDCIMNSYGVYVVDATKVSADVYDIRFGCDQARLKNREVNAEEKLKYYELSGSSKKYMRVSGVLEATGTLCSDGVERAFCIQTDSNGKIVNSFDYQFVFDKKNGSDGADEQVSTLNAKFETSGKWYSGKFIADCVPQEVDVKGVKKTVYVVHVINVAVDGNIERSDAQYSYGVKESSNVLLLQVPNGSVTQNVYVNTADCLTPSSLVNAIDNAIKTNGLNNVVKSVSLVENKIVFSVESGSTISVVDHKFDTALGYAPNDDFAVKFSNGSTPINFDFEDVLASATTVDEFVTAINTKLAGTGVELRYSGIDDKGQTVYWDHFEFRGDKEFSLINCGASKRLKQLGFDPIGAKKYGDNTYRIIGSALLGCDWSKLISLEGLAGSANMEMFADLTLSVNKAKVSADVTVVGVDLEVDGKVDLSAKFCGERLKDNEQKDQNGFQNWSFTPTLSVTNGAGISVTPSVNLGGSALNLSAAQILLTKENGDSQFGVSFDTQALVDSVRNVFGNFSMENVYAVLDSVVKQLSSFIKKSDVKIPVINKSVGELVNVANDIRDIVTELRRSNISNLQNLEAALLQRLENFGLKGLNNSKLFEIKSVKVEADTCYDFNFNVLKKFSTVHQFNFGTAGCGVSGNADLNVSGDFSFSLSARASFSGAKFDLKLNDAIGFGASVNIIGEKLSFNLGIDTDSNDKDSLALLKNIITVGSNDQNSFVCAKAALSASFGSSQLSFSSWSDSLNPVIEFPIAVYGKLPISVTGYSLGDIWLGKYTSGSLNWDKTNLSAAKSFVNDAVQNYGSKPEDVFLLNLVNSTSSATPSNNNDNGLFAVILDDSKLPSSDRFVVDFSDVIAQIKEIASGNIDWFDKIKLAVTGLNTLLDTLEANMNSGLMKDVKSVPVVGSALNGGVDFLTTLKHKILEPFSDFVYESTGLNAKMLAEKMNSILDGYFYLDKSKSGETIKVNVLPDSDTFKWSQINGQGTYYRSGEEKGKGHFAEWFFRLGKDYSLGTDLGLDLGFPGLGLEADGGVNLGLNWNLEFGFGVSENGGFYFIFGDGDELSVSADASLNATIMGKLAGLGLVLDMKNGGSADVSLSFGVDVDGKINNDPTKISLVREKNVTTSAGGTETTKTDTKNFKALKISEALGQLPKFTFDAGAKINALITVGFASDLSSKAGENTPKFPNIEGNFVFDWNKSGIQELGFTNLQIKMGEFISGVLGPIVSKIQTVVEPLKPLIDFLTTPFPVLDDLGVRITPLDLAKEFSKGKFDDSMVYAIKDLIVLSDKISKIKNSASGLSLDIGNFNLIRKGLNPYNAAANNFLSGNAVKTSLDSSLANYGDTKDASGNELNVASEASKKLAANGLNVGSGAWHFFWDTPQDIFKLLLGQDIPLVEYDMPKLSFDFNWDTFIRIWGPLGARLGVSFNATIDLGFGYDTFGIRQWVGSGYKDYGRLLNGFYVNDYDKDGKDKAELSFYGGLTAAAELNAGVSAGVGGGVGINVNFNLYDPNHDGKVRLNEITQLFKSEGLFGFFDVDGAITAKLYAYVDLLFYTKKWNITGDITLFEFEFGHDTKPLMNTENEDGNLVANMGSNASSRVADEGNLKMDDPNERLEVTISGKKVTDQFKNESTVKGAKYVIKSEDGVDEIILKGEADFDIEIDAGAGDDFIDLSGLKLSGNHYALIKGGAGSDTIIGAQGLNIIFGDEGVLRIDDEKDDEKGTHKAYRLTAEADVGANNAGGDVILGGSAHDIIFGGAENDSIDGGEGVDYIFGDSGSWSIETSLSASDYAKYAESPDEVLAKALQNISKNGLNGDADKDSVLVSRTDISLDGGADKLIGGAGNDVVYGGGGDDHIDGGAGNDTIYGEKGHDRILGGAGDDVIHGGEGMDVIFGDGVEISDLAQSFAIDTSKKTAAFSQEFIDAQFAAGDTAISSSKFEFDDGEKKKINKKAGSYTQLSQEATSTSSDKYGSDHIYGEDGNDLLFGDSGSTSGNMDYIFGGIGNDIIDGDGGNDTISGGVDNDIIYGGTGDDVIDGGAGNDSLYGDEGVTDYDTSTLTAGNKLSGKTNNTDKVVFGDNLGLHGVIYAGSESKTDGGNDKITTGPGMDFVDGQGGSDKIVVNMMGESSTNYSNITDSGKDGADTLVVEATEGDDELLMRMNQANSLGFVALIPQESPEGETQNLSLNTNIERVNFTSAIETVNLNANGGNDKIVIDGTAKTTNVDGGAGKDSIQIGQLYNSERVYAGGETGPSMVQPIDEFHTVKTNEEKYLSDGVTLNTILNVEGNIDEDTFVALNNKGSLNMVGGKGDDKFSVYSFQDEKDNTIVRGPVSIDGGSGNDSMFVRGTNGDDTVVLSKDGLLSNVVSVKAAGVETSTFDAAAGDDIFNVIGNNKGEINNLNGGKGNDTFNMGSLDADYTLRGSSTEGQSCDIKYEVLDESNQVIESTTESFTVIDTSTEPVVFVSATESGIAPVDLSISEGGYTEFYLHYAGDTLNGNAFSEIKVYLTAPMLSEKAKNSGAREIMLAEVSVDETTKAETVGAYQSVLPVTLNSSITCVKVRIHCFGDNLVEEETLKSISVSCVCDETTTLTKSVSSIALKINAEDSKRDSEADCLLAMSEEFNVTGNTVQLSSIADSSVKNISAYFVGEDNFLSENTDFTIDRKNHTLHLNASVTEKTIVVVYRSDSMRIDSSKAHLAYDDVDLSKINIAYKADGSKNFVNVNTLKGTLKYELQGDTLVFYNSSNGRMITLHGELKITPKNATDKNVFLPPEAGLTTGQAAPAVVNSGIVISLHSNTLTESGSFNATSFSVRYSGSFAGGKSVTVRISVLDAVNAVNKDGVISTGKELEFVDASGVVIGDTLELTFTPEDASQPQMVYVRAKSDLVAEEYGYVTAHKTEEKRINDIEGAVYAFGMGASVDLDVDTPTMLSYAHKVEVKAGSTPEEANKFNEKNEYDASKLFDIAKVSGNTFNVTFDASNDSAMAILKSLEIDLQKDSSFEGKTIRFVAKDKDGIKVVVNEEDHFVHESAWFKIISCKKNGNGSFTLTLNEDVTLFTETNSKVLFSGNKDYLFIDEDNSVDRLFVNNQSDSDDKFSSLNGFDKNSGNLSAAELAAFGTSADVIKANIQLAEASVLSYDSHAVRFNHEDIGARGITAAQMEYGEYNLGTGKDHVEINKTLYRDDAFRTFTVVNTGDDKRADKDTNTVDFGYEIGSGSFVSRSVTEGAEVLFHYEFNVPEHTSGVNVTDALTAENIYYVEAIIKKLKNGSTTEYTETRQRREIVGNFSSTDGFNIKYDFILADGESIDGFMFYCAEFDDEIVIKSHQSDRKNGNSTVICSGTEVSVYESTPAEESAATETPVASEEPAAEGDAPAATEETGSAESETPTADTPAEAETTATEGTASASVQKFAEPNGIVYKFTMNSGSFEEGLKGFNTAKENDGERAANGYAYCLYVDATMSDGSVQRRVVNGMTSTTFGIDRDFTLSTGVTIVSVKFAYGYEGDGQLVINAQSGNDKIDASSNDVTRNDMVVFGGLGDDYITMNKGGIAFGDRGQVKYDNGQVNGKDVHETVLGSILSEDGKTYYGDYTTGIDKRATDDAKDAPAHRLQTDGVNRDAKDIHSVDDSNGGVDMIYVGGTDSVVIGGAKGDVIAVGGDKNVVLGDNGSVKYYNATNNNAVYGDKLGLGLHTVETTSDAVGEVDNIVIAGNKNVAMGGAMGDSIRITGADNVAIGDGGKYTVEAKRLYAESKSDTIGGQDYISTGDGKNAVIGGTDKDTIYTGAGNDAIIGDGGKIVMDTDRNALMMTNAGRNINKDNPDAAYEDGSAGADKIIAGNGDNIVFGGLENDSITTGSGEDVVFGDNAYATFQGNYKVAGEETDTELPTFQTGNSNEEREIKDQSILSFNFTGDSDKRITSEMEAGVEPAKNWNNISGHLSGTYGNNDNEIVRFDDGTRASAISVSYGGHENHRTTSTDSRINLQGYNHWMNGNDGNTILMNSGLMTTAPNQQCGSLLEVSVDGLAQYYESYYVFVYLDIPDSHSSYKESVRKITLSTEDGKYKKSFYIDDRAGKTFSGSFVQSSNETADAAIEAVKANDPKAVENYVVFRVEKQFATDRIIIKVEDGLNPYNYNGKDLPGIAGLQIKGDLHKQDVAVSTDIDFGGNDVIDSNGGDDIVVGGTGSDVIVTYGDERYSIDDNDVVYGDNAKLLFADRDNNPNTATTLTKAESIAATNLDATYDDAIRTGDGNDVVVGGIGSDAIFSGDVKNDDGTEETAGRFEAVKDNDAEKNTDKVKLDNLEILSFNFTANNSGDEARVAHGVAAGVVVDDDWHDFYRNDRGVLMCDDTKAGWTPSEYENEVNKIANNHTFNTFATVNGVNVDLYGRSVQNNNSLGLSAYTQENVAELDGDTANSKIFNSSLALHSQEEIILKLSGLNNYLADKESGETKDDKKTYDVYVYLGGDNDNSDTYNFVYDIFSDSCGSYQGEHRYVNDWVGHFFDGDYREAKCTDANKARVVAENGVTPRIEMIGNYVVFRGVTGDNFTVHIRNYHIPGTNQWPKNLPVITAVQIVTGKGRFELNEDGNPKTVNGEKVRANVAIGGDHDKDLVFGDDAYLEFDFDIPYGVGENINEFQNRVVSANSMAINHDDAVKVDTRDIIYTGKDRDVVVGGEDADTIKTGAADDVVVGDNANLMMEHNNPIGVFTPSNEITLDDHTIDTSTKEDYLGHDNVTVETIQRKYDPNWGNQNNGYMGWGPNGWGWYSYNNNNARGKIDGIKEPADTENTGRKDNIVDDEGSNLLIEGQSGTEKLFDPESLQSSEDPNNNENPDVNNEDPNNNENPDVNNEDPNNNVQDPENMREVYAGNMYEETKISIGAGESIKLIITKWDKGDQWYTPNIGLKVDASGNHSLVITWDELGETSSQGQSDNSDPITFTNVAFVDIPNTSNVENEDKIVLVIRSEEAFQFSVYLTNLG